MTPLDLDDPELDIAEIAESSTEPETSLEEQLAPLTVEPLADSRCFAATIALMPTSTPTLAQIFEEFTARGCPQEPVWRALSHAINEHWLELWEEIGPETCISLTRAAADELEIELTTESTSWIPRTTAETVYPKVRRLDYEEIAELQEDNRPDPRMQEPWEIVSATEEAGYKGEPLTDGGHAPVRWIFLGLRRPWPVPPARECPIHGPYLRWNHYCLVCDHSGVDALLPAVAPPGRRKAHRTGRLKGGV